MNDASNNLQAVVQIYAGKSKQDDKAACIALYSELWILDQTVVLN